MTPPVKPEPLETRPIEPARPKLKRARKGWKGRRTPLRPCNAPGDEMWREQGAGE